MTLLLFALFACAVSILTFFAGFGLGTLLLPAFALVLAPEIAVAATAIVHFANNLFKVALLARHARRDVVLRFGIPAMIAAFAGAALLGVLAADTPLLTWRLAGREATITPVKLVLGLLIVGFGLFELVPRLRKLRAAPKWLPAGGLLAGFFGGLSGHQGALRAAFLAPLNMPPQTFAATQAVLAAMVDVTRLTVYVATFLTGSAAAVAIPWGLVGAATIGALAGAVAGRAMLSSVTIEGLHRLTGVLLLAVGAALALGVI